MYTKTFELVFKELVFFKEILEAFTEGIMHRQCQIYSHRCSPVVVLGVLLGVRLVGRLVSAVAGVLGVSVAGVVGMVMGVLGLRHRLRHGGHVAANHTAGDNVVAANFDQGE